MKRWCWYVGLASSALVVSASAPASPSSEANDVPGTEVTAPTSLRAATGRIAGQIAAADPGATARRGPAMATAATGAAAGDGMSAYGPWGLWGGAAFVKYDDDFAPTAFDADLSSYVVGLDVGYTGNVVFGIAGAVESTETDTRFNAGRVDTGGFTVVPYLAVLFTDRVSADLAVGFSWLDTDQRRIDGTGTLSSSKFDSNRWFLAGNVTGTWQSGGWITVLRAGGLYTQEDQDGYTETNGNRVGSRDVELGQISAGGEIAYSTGVLEPFVGATYRYDVSRDKVVLAAAPQPDNDRDELQFVLGLRYFYQAVAASLTYDKVYLREDFDSDAFNLTLRAEF